MIYKVEKSTKSNEITVLCQLDDQCVYVCMCVRIYLSINFSFFSILTGKKLIEVNWGLENPAYI